MEVGTALPKSLADNGTVVNHSCDSISTIPLDNPSMTSIPTLQAREDSTASIMSSSEPVIGEGSMELDMLRASRGERSMEPGVVCERRPSKEQFRAWAGDFSARLETLEVAAEQSSARAVVAEVSMDPAMYCGMGADADRDGEQADAPPSSWQSQVQEMHDRTCRCGDFRNHFRPLAPPVVPRSSSKKAPVQPRQSRK